MALQWKEPRLIIYPAKSWENKYLYSYPVFPSTHPPVLETPGPRPIHILKNINFDSISKLHRKKLNGECPNTSGNIAKCLSLFHWSPRHRVSSTAKLHGALRQFNSLNQQSWLLLQMLAVTKLVKSISSVRREPLAHYLAHKNLLQNHIISKFNKM